MHEHSQSTASKWESLYMTPPESGDGHDIGQLLRNFAKELYKLNNHLPIRISELYLKQESAHGNGSPILFAQYYTKTDEDQGIDVGYKEWTREHKVSHPIEEVEYSTDPTLNPPINLLIVRLPQGASQNNVALLLETAAAKIDEVRDAQVTDITYHDVIDDDALEHPFLHVYFRNNKQHNRVDEVDSVIRN